MSLPEVIPSALPQFVRNTARTNFSNSVIPAGAVLLFAESDGNGGSNLIAKNPDGSFTEIGGDDDGSGLIYGVLYDPSNSSPICQRVIHEEGVLKPVGGFPHMPAHKFRRCVMDDLSTRHVNYYLDEYDSNLKEDGETSSVLTGSDGDVMVEIPITYWSVTTQQDGKILYLISDKEFTGSEPHPFFYVSPGGATLRNQYVGAYKAVLCNASGIPLNTSDQSASNSGTYQSGYMLRSVKGAKPWAEAARSTVRTAAAAAGGYPVNALFHQYLILMCMIEAGSLDSQFYISPGFTFVASSYGGYATTRFTGRCNYGNGTGSLKAESQDNLTWRSGDAEALKIVQFQYRGIENPWGEAWTVVDGIVKTNTGYYMTADCTAYSDSNYTNTYTFYEYTWPNTGWIKGFDPRTFFPTTTGGSASTYFPDTFWTYNDTHKAMYGGANILNTQAGMGCLNMDSGLDTSGGTQGTTGFRISA